MTDKNFDLMMATNNKNKVLELNQLFSNSTINVYLPENGEDVEETGKTYRDNAYLKAKAYYDKFKRPVMADDSGVSVAALPSELGLYSARFGGPGLTPIDRCHLLLEKLKDVPDDKRSAKFICTLCVILNDHETYFFEGEVKGKIGYEMKGENGFGYDPLFLPEELDYKKSLAEVPDWKKENSHRSRASQKVIQFFEKKSCQN